MTDLNMDFKAEARRQKYIEVLYERAGRSNGLYSGLYLQRIEHLLQQDMAEVLGEED